ncbi:MAG: T9SS type A sorting domain-containing protein [Chitinispirillales bacterium]|jgi:hypothetical protein|nr:T9SS type A sorting domain-containing protein [Chitinispirillales bacterium]
MKRFLIVAAVAVMLTGLGAQAADYTACTGATAGYCKWDECYAINTCSGTGCGETGTDCSVEYQKCLQYSSSHSVYSDAACSQAKEQSAIQECGEWCDWGANGCHPIKTNPTASTDDPTVTTTCAEAKANCDAGGSGRFDNATCSGDPIGGARGCGDYCDWGAGGCWEIKPDTTYTTCEAAIAHCDADGARYSSSTCTGTQVGGEQSCGGSCLWETGCVELKTNANNTPEPILTCEAARANCQSFGQLFSDGSCQTPVSVRLIANKSVAKGLKVSYAKNRVTVNWTPATKVSSGTVQLINMKGAAISTAFIKANSSKVSVKLGTVGVPAGMYFVHINAVGQNGKKIVTQSTISIVK